MSKFYYYILPGITWALLGCSSNESETITPPPEMQIWQTTISATNEDLLIDNDEVTRAVFVGGNTDRFGVLWDSGDVVCVYQGDTQVGTLTPVQASWGQASGTLTGTLTGNFSVGQQLDLYLNGRDVDFSGQNGSLQSISSKVYAMATVPITSITGNTITFEDVFLAKKSAFIKFSFTDKETGKRLNPKRLELTPVSGGAAMLTGTYSNGNIVASTTGSIAINAVISGGEYSSVPYLAILKSGSTKVTFKLKVTLENDDVYIGPVAPQNAYSPALNPGTMGSCSRAMQKTTDVNDITVTIDNEHSTTTDPVIVVTDGTTTLVEGTDYSKTLNYENSTLKSVTITGLADDTSSAFCTTPYIGTRTMNLNLSQISPSLTEWIITDIEKSI